MRPTMTAACILAALLTGPWDLPAQESPHPEHRYFELGDFDLESGATLPPARILYITAGTLDGARSNTILVPSYAGGNHHGHDFLLGPGGGLDTTRHFVILAEMFGSGGSSSPPAPRLRYVRPEMIAAVYVELGDHEAAFTWLDEALRIRSAGLTSLKTSLRWDPIRADPRFRALLSRVGFPP